MGWANVVMLVLSAIGPNLRQTLTEAVLKYETMAKATPDNKVDDLVAAVLKWALGVK